MNLDYKLIGLRIKNYRNQQNITQNQLSEMLDVSNVYISKIERGTTKINLEMLYKISIILNIPISFLLTGIDEESNNYLDSEIAELISKCGIKKKKLIYELIKAVVKS
ncbi:helix-turn-helix domain-containing protein [Clostridium beijerinckii]|uniref:HTH cro/C1-type domain-containing protein n=1 Tax=Clostridium beijerinckii TaxID=1520 RepID=A0A1S9N5P7_CLOBE|nr:helix-turn-helix transcriptional regulator [Clostridium beijerinckii]OOP72857.1 hypothetical protein CBEIBR21_13655 [Clostridium beijerinckii]